MKPPIELSRSPDRSAVRRRIPTNECFHYEEPTVVDRVVRYRGPNWALLIVGTLAFLGMCLGLYLALAPQPVEGAERGAEHAASRGAE